ncbi:reverse transcriptase family protein [Chitinophaga nivalis]|uniref:RNA-directed DNA polymerase n=1 Tax=Chitinophaga nivalis TaxID=2991709 RepID=A0ABT3ILM5_9BACT|nr:reverse transcriptase family protein [Chitinophaga nivalis]MCW3465429.1 reverse transcriptase family protein [Chitinophaga nivalis]MCW3484879.1 reverse transcriptase family protein [Chitinophaga nivalis]
MAEGLTRQQLYDKIRASSKEEHILEEMIRLGFWAQNTAQPSPSETLIRKEGVLRRELNQLLEERQKYRNKEKMLADMRKERMAKSKLKRAETKKRNEEKRKERAAAWTELSQQQIVYLGEEVSAGLNKTVSDTAQLEKFGLPLFHDATALALAMGTTLGKLRYLAFNRKTGTHTHYQRFQIPKKSGGTRVISAPMPQLKAAQHWILENILYKIKNSESAHGFVPGKSIVTNAAPHIGQDIVINLDLRDFFPSIAYKRVKGLFCKLGYSEQVATILGLICTEPEVDEITLDNRKYYVAKTARHLPQGAPTSPAITNLICFKLDRRFEGLAARYGYAYTRYADDMTFSAKATAADDAGQLLWAVKQVVKEEGFTLHPDKLKVMQKGDRREVTGIVVNDKLSLDRTTLHRFRALLHQIGKTGLSGKTWGKGKNIISSIEGYANYVYMVKPEQGAKLKATLAALLQREDIKAEARQIWTGEPLPVAETPAAGVTETPAPTPAPAASASVAAATTPPPAAGEDSWWKIV